MRVAVVIPAFDEGDWIVGAIASAAAECAEVIVADGGSGDGTRDRAAAAGARVVHSPKGRAQQLEAGVEASDADVLLFLHADTRLPVGYAKAIDTALHDSAVVGGAFRFGFDQLSPSLRVVQFGARVRSGVFRLPYGDQAIFIRRTALREIGGVPQVPIMEDLDLVAAMRQLGRLEIVPLTALTSARRYIANGVWRTVAHHSLAAGARALGLNREGIARWIAR